MLIVRITGLALIAIGTLAGLAMLASAAGLPVTVSLAGVWLLFLLSFLGGFVLLAVGLRGERGRIILRIAGGVLVFHGLAAALCLLLAAVALLEPRNVYQLWALFLICLPAGVVLALVGELWGVATNRGSQGLVKRTGSPPPRPRSADQGSSPR
jgi:membrane-associated phospholipid phosphatase